ncbi:MAG: hypothetical protein OXH09_11850 [Gammaproteobacteria bacterium]|nr:hypothetical protein [Gammaproteobacteria bacterium]
MEEVNTSERRCLRATRILACVLCVLIPAWESLAGSNLADDALWNDDRDCNQARAKAKKESDDPDVLYLLALCTSGDRYIERRAGLLVRGLEIDPKNADLLSVLALTIQLEDPAGAGVDAATLDRHRRTLYEIAETPVDKVRALGFMYDAAVTVGDEEAAAEIRHRARRVWALDALDYGPEHRADSLRTVCSTGVFAFDLEDMCIAVLEALAGESAHAGEVIPDDVLAQIHETARKLFQRVEWQSGPKTRASERLNAILATHPASVRSSEHYRVYAATQTTWRDRIAALRRAVELDIGNQRARCALGVALAWTGAQDEAWEVFAELAAEADDQPACNAAEALQYFKRGVAGTAQESLDDLPRVFHY